MFKLNYAVNDWEFGLGLIECHRFGRAFLHESSPFW
jgi:hypothetical protein